MLLAAAADDDPVFAELKHIVAVDEDHYYYVITELGFHAHFHAYEIHPTMSTLAVIITI